MIRAVSLSQWVTRLAIALMVVYSAWWLGDLDKSFLNLLKIVMELLLPALFGEIRSLMHSVDGGWRVNTLLSPHGDYPNEISFEIGRVFLYKSVVWVPAASALVAVSAQLRFRALVVGVGLILSAAISVVVVCVAAHLAVLVNNTTAILDDDILPPPPGIALDVVGYPFWYFHAITFMNYLGMLAAPLAMPVLIWLMTCHREVALMLRSHGKPQG